MPAKLRPLWTCPNCGHKFVTRNMWHSCGVFPLENHFEGKSPRTVELFHRYVKLIEKFGPFTVEPKKTGISFLMRVRFGGAVIRKNWLEARLWLKRPVKHPALTRTEKVTARDYVHYFRIRSADDMDKAFIGLLGEAYAIGRQEHLMR